MMRLVVTQCLFGELSAGEAFVFDATVPNASEGAFQTWIRDNDPVGDTLARTLVFRMEIIRE